jgi:lipopolysaccharide biosynthesis glycosyltransferase
LSAFDWQRKRKALQAKSKSRNGVKKMKNENVIPIFFASDEKYMPFLAITLTSMKEYISPNRVYNIHVLYSGELGENAEKVLSLAEENFRISFTDVSAKSALIQSVMRCRDYYTSAIYFRLFIPELFPCYDKAIYLDCDIVLRADIAKLYDIPIGDAYVGAVADEVVSAIPEFCLYVKEALGIAPKKYFNSGVLTMNLKALRALDFFKTFYGILSSYDFVVAPDQDCLNLICEDKVFYYGGEWNKMPMAGNAISAPKLIHYNLCMKPWHYDGIAYEEYFWATAKKTCFYETVLAKKTAFTKAQAERDKKDGKNLLTLAKSEAENPNNYFRSVRSKG